MRQAVRHRPVNRSCSYSSRARQSGELGPATLRASNLLAVVCLVFGTASAAFLSASLEQRIGNLFFFGLIPAVGLHAGGHILSRILVLSSELCEMIAARCFRCLALFVNDLVSRAGPSVSKELAKLSRRRQKAFCSVHRCYWQAHAAIFELTNLLIRILSHLLVFSGKLLVMIAACFRCLALFVNDLVSWAGPSVSKASAKLSRQRQKAFCSVHRRYWRAHAAMFELSYRLIRSAARFAIRMQASQLEERPITYRRLPASRQWTRRPAAL